MLRSQRLPSILALAAYLLAGGWGPGSYWMRCEAADGTVQIETRFTLCCTDERAEAEHAVGVARPADASLQVADEGCGPCVDTPLLSAFIQPAKDRHTSQRFEQTSPLTVLFTASTFAVTPHMPSSVPVVPQHVSARAAVETVVLRC
jgi:hypothetical protein